MNEGSDADGSHAEKYVSDDVAENLKTIYKHVSKQFVKKFEEEKTLWENFFKGY